MRGELVQGLYRPARVTSFSKGISCPLHNRASDAEDYYCKINYGGCVASCHHGTKWFGRTVAENRTQGGRRTNRERRVGPLSRSRVEGEKYYPTDETFSLFTHVWRTLLRRWTYLPKYNLYCAQRFPEPSRVEGYGNIA